MSLELLVILGAGSAPDIAAWNNALLAAKTPASFMETVDLAEQTGFLPVALNGRETGFSLLTMPLTEVLPLYSELRRVTIENPVVYSFGWGGDFHECAAVFFSASALVSTFDGVAFDPQEGKLMTASELLDAANQCYTLANE